MGEAEVDASAGAGAVVAALRQHHLAVVRNAFSASHRLLVELRDAIEVADHFACTYANSPGRLGKNSALSRFGELDFLRRSPAFPIQHVPLAVSALDLMFRSSPVVLRTIGQVVAPRFSYHSGWARPENSATSPRRTEWLWHQDRQFHRGEDLTIWIPLTPCGHTAPAIEFLVSQTAAILPPSADGWSISTDSLEGAGELFAPAFEVGDCAIFDGYAIHRTNASAEMTDPRTSVDIRVTAVN